MSFTRGRSSAGHAADRVYFLGGDRAQSWFGTFSSVFHGAQQRLLPMCCADPAALRGHVTGRLSPRLHNQPPNQTAHTPEARPREALTRKWNPIRISGNRMEKERKRDEGRHAQE
ncbi:hypothetical protein NDU88_004480 [Pleurodeles waltl]|uniref:Uncharacterized protein n=1 Tax=Pleurodeles waltl TaxID=8319 RepID=A0AAV7LPE0_PLEWA|nr:hypothetical protein NDU88_004480 [Pleurodeles waltl]